MAFATKAWVAAVLTSSDMNTYVTDPLDFLKENIALEAPVELTLDGAGAVTKTKSYHTIDTFGDAASGDLVTINGGSDGDVIFLKAEHTNRTVILKDGTGNLAMGGDVYLDQTGLIIPLLYCSATSQWLAFTGYHEQHTFLVNGLSLPLSGTDWSASLEGATLAQNKAAKKAWIPLNFLKIGDHIVSYKLVGDAIEGNALTIDCKLVRINKTDPITTTDVAGGAIIQIAADGNFDSEAVLTALEDIVTDKQYVFEIEATTTAGDSIILMGVEVVILRH